MSLSHLLRSAGAAFESWRRRRAAALEFDRCDRSEIERIAADLRIPADELRTLAARGTDSASLLDRRLAATAMSPDAIGGEVLRDMQRCCSGCDDKANCASDLEHKPVPARWPSYCPNAGTIASIPATCCH